MKKKPLIIILSCAAAAVLVVTTAVLVFAKKEAVPAPTPLLQALVTTAPSTPPSAADPTPEITQQPTQQPMPIVTLGPTLKPTPKPTARPTSKPTPAATTSPPEAKLTDDGVIFIFKKEFCYINQPRSAADFPEIEIAEIRDLTYINYDDENLDLTYFVEENYRQTLFIRLKNPGKQNVLDAVDLLKQRPDAEQVFQNFFAVIA